MQIANHSCRDGTEVTKRQGGRGGGGGVEAVEEEDLFTHRSPLAPPPTVAVPPRDGTRLRTPLRAATPAAGSSRLAPEYLFISIDRYIDRYI